MSADTSRVKPYTGPYELNFFVDDVDFWDKYLMFKQEYYRCIRVVMENSRFPRLMEEFYVTTDPVKFLELYEMLCNYINVCPPKVWEGEEIRIDQTMSELRRLGYNKSHKLGFRTRFSGLYIYGEPRRYDFIDAHVTMDVPVLDNLPVVYDNKPSDPKKLRRQRIRDMKIKTGQIRR